jgi:hypothetical protein
MLAWVSPSKLAAPGANIKKTFFFVNYKRLNQAREFVPEKPYQLSLIFVCKGVAYLSKVS